MKRSPVSGCIPESTTPHTLKKCPAGSFFGITGAIALHIRSEAYIIVSQYVETEAGFSHVNMVLSGQIIFKGLKQPSFAGIEGSVREMSTARAAEYSPVLAEFTGPGT